MFAALQRDKAGISLVELVVAVALLSLVSLAAVQLLNMTERTMVGSQTDMNQQLRSESIASFIYKDFSRGELSDNVISRTYTNSSMPEDLQGGAGVTVVALYGKSTRFKGVDPLCALEQAADPAAGTFQMRANCMNRSGPTIVAQMNDLIAKGIILTTGLEGGIGRCSISKPITIDPVTNIATVSVDDSNCLRSGANRTVGMPKGTLVLLPRFVAYDSADPRIFHTTMIEPPDLATSGIGLEMPDTENVTGGAIPNRVPFVDVLADNSTQIGTLLLETDEDTAKLFVSNAPGSVTTSGANTRKLKLSGPVADIRAALTTLHYVSPGGFFGSDRISGKFGSGSEIKRDATTLNVSVNCGGQICEEGPPTGLRFDLGAFDPVTGKFKINKYITSVSMCGNQMPSRFFGYCRRGYIFDQASGQPRTDATPPCVDHGDFANNPAAGKLNAHFPFIRKSPSFREFHRPDHVSIYLYEQFKGNESAISPKGDNATTNNRFSPFFIFDTVDQSGGNVNFTLSNIESGRNLRDLQDPFTMSDDPTDFLPGIIGTDGTLTTDSGWGIAHDGGVVPLRLPDSAFDSSTGFFELKNYTQGDPQLKLRSWKGLQGWNIRAVNEDSTDVTWLSIPFDNATSTQKTDFKLVISAAQRCR